MTRRLFLAYVAIVVGPLLVGAAAFALRDLLAGRRPAGGNGRAGAEALEHTVEEVQAT